jgi:hypothetical protein
MLTHVRIYAYSYIHVCMNIYATYIHTHI